MAVEEVGDVGTERDPVHTAVGLFGGGVAHAGIGDFGAGEDGGGPADTEAETGREERVGDEDGDFDVEEVGMDGGVGLVGTLLGDAELEEHTKFAIGVGREGEGGLDAAVDAEVGVVAGVVAVDLAEVDAERESGVETVLSRQRREQGQKDDEDESRLFHFQGISESFESAKIRRFFNIEAVEGQTFFNRKVKKLKTRTIGAE